MAEKVKSSEKQAREVLRYVKTAWWDMHYPADIFVGGPDSDEGVNEIVKIRGMLDDALAASETTDLERLVEWLQARCFYGKYVDMREPGGYERTLKHIADTFGVGEKAPD